MRLLWINDKTEGGGAVKLFGAARSILEPHGHQLVPFFGLFGPDIVDPEWEQFQPPRVQERNPLTIGLRAFPSRPVTRQLERLIEASKPDAAVVQNVHQYLSPAVFRTLREYGIPSVFLLNDYALYCVNKYAFRDGRPCHKCIDQRYYRGALLGCSLKSGLMGHIESGVRAASLHHSRITKAFTYAGAIYTNGVLLTKRLVDFGFPTSRIVTGVFPLSLDVQPLENPDDIADYFVYYGSGAPIKGQDVLLDALDHVEIPLKIKLCLLRPSPALSRRVELINSIGKHRVELDATSRWETGVRETVQRARAIVVPSLWNSPHELVTYESFALGKAVVVSSNTGNADLVRHGHDGLLFETGSARSLAAQIHRLALDPGYAIQLGNAARGTYERELLPEMWYQPFMRAVDIACGLPPC